MRKKVIMIVMVLGVVVLFSSFASISSAAQTAGLTLSLSRDFGYAGFNNDIQGLFSITVQGPSGLERVEYYLDSTKLGESQNPPFRLQFTTDSYALGWHKLTAVGYMTDGRALNSNSITVEFVPAKSSLGVILPILAVVLLAVLAASLIPLLSGRKLARLTPGSERSYGVGGGAVCPRCDRPFPLTIFSMHVGSQKLARCPFCGKWSFVHAEALDVLRRAEKDEIDKSEPLGPVARETEADTMNKDIDESKYQD
jgi:hypothetical protein